MSMISFERLAATGAKVRGTLLCEYDRENDLPLLDQDILEISLPNGSRIDVGWFPENDPDGRFVIRAFRKQGALIRGPLEATTPLDVEKIVTALVEDCTQSHQDRKRKVH